MSSLYDEIAKEQYVEEKKRMNHIVKTGEVVTLSGFGKCDGRWKVTNVEGRTINLKRTGIMAFIRRILGLV